MQLEDDTKKVLLGVLLRQAVGIFEKGFKPEYYSEVTSIANLLARAGEFSKAFELVSKLKRKRDKKPLFGEIIESYRLYLTTDKNQEEMECLSHIDVILKSGNIQAARMWPHVTNHKLELTNIYLSIYRRTRETQDLQAAIANLRYVYPSHLDDTKRAINEACGKNIFPVQKRKKSETNSATRLPSELEFDYLMRQFIRDREEQSLQDLITIAISTESPKEQLGYIRRIVWILDQTK